MQFRSWTSILLAFSVLPAAGNASEPAVQMAWPELGQAVQGKQVALVLPDGARIEGKVLAVNADAMSMNIRKSSYKMLHPKGTASIPRASVTTFEIRERRTRWQIIGVAIGLGVGIPICAFAATYANNEGGDAAGLCAAAIGGGAGLGLLAGTIDKGVKRIQVRP